MRDLFCKTTNQRAHAFDRFGVRSRIIRLPCTPIEIVQALGPRDGMLTVDRDQAIARHQTGILIGPDNRHEHVGEHRIRRRAGLRNVRAAFYEADRNCHFAVDADRTVVRRVPVVKLVEAGSESIPKRPAVRCAAHGLERADCGGKTIGARINAAEK